MIVMKINSLTNQKIEIYLCSTNSDQLEILFIYLNG